MKKVLLLILMLAFTSGCETLNSVGRWTLDTVSDLDAGVSIDVGGHSYRVGVGGKKGE